MRGKVSTTDSPRGKSSSPAKGIFFSLFFSAVIRLNKEIYHKETSNNLNQFIQQGNMSCIYTGKKSNHLCIQFPCYHGHPAGRSLNSAICDEVNRFYFRVSCCVNVKSMGFSYFNPCGLHLWVYLANSCLIISVLVFSSELCGHILVSQLISRLNIK